MNSVFKKYKILVLSLQLFISGCVKDLVPENNGYQPKVAVWAILNLDSTISIITSGNRGLEDKDVVEIPAIDMFLYEDGLLADQLFAQSISSEIISHHFKIKPVNLKTYSLKIANSTLEIFGSVQMPNPLIKPDEVKLTQGDNAQLTYTISDDIVFNDAYQFDVEIRHFGMLKDTANAKIIDSFYVFTKKYDTYDEPALNYNILGLNNQLLTNYTFPVNDNLFNGNKKTFIFTVHNPVSNHFFEPRKNIVGRPVSDELIATKEYVLIKCRKISPEYYKFMISENRNNAIFGTPYYNPTNVYSNITGGLGLMAGVAERVDTVWIRK